MFVVAPPVSGLLTARVKKGSTSGGSKASTKSMSTEKEREICRGCDERPGHESQLHKNMSVDKAHVDIMFRRIPTMTIGVNFSDLVCGGSTR